MLKLGTPYGTSVSRSWESLCVAEASHSRFHSEMFRAELTNTCSCSGKKPRQKAHPEAMRCWHLVGRPGLFGAPHGCPIPRLAALGLDADLGFSRILGGQNQKRSSESTGPNPKLLGLSVGNLQVLRSSAFWVCDFKGPFRTGAVWGR